MKLQLLQFQITKITRLDKNKVTDYKRISIDTHRILDIIMHPRLRINTIFFFLKKILATFS